VLKLLQILSCLYHLQKPSQILPFRLVTFLTQPTWQSLDGDGEDLAGEMVGDGEDLDGDGAMMAGDTVVGVVAGEEAGEDLGILSLTKTSHLELTSAVLPLPRLIPRLLLHQLFILEF